MREGSVNKKDVHDWNPKVLYFFVGALAVSKDMLASIGTSTTYSRG